MEIIVKSYIKNKNIRKNFYKEFKFELPYKKDSDITNFINDIKEMKKLFIDNLNINEKELLYFNILNDLKISKQKYSTMFEIYVQDSYIRKLKIKKFLYDYK